MSGARDPRICMPSWRQFSRRVYQCGLFEAQDVLAACDDVDVITLDAGPQFRWRERWHDRLVFRDVSHQLALMNPGLRPRVLTRDYDLFVAFCGSYEDLLYINAVKGWKERCRASVCWIDEIWAASIPKYRHWLPIFRQFDRLLVSHRDTAAPLEAATGRPCTFMPAAVDAVRFSPYPRPPARAIDIFSIGRRSDGLHRALTSLARERGWYYVHDTFRASLAETYDPIEHRTALANTAKRSRYFLVAPPKVDRPEETGGQVEIGWRYFEGAAAGCVLVGQPADCRWFHDLFDWPDVVMAVDPNGSNVAEILGALEADPARVAAMSQRNAVEALLRHDWVYRWHAVLDLMGLAPTDRMLAREAALGDLARLAGASGPARSGYAAAS
jgi:hypothetical protein